MSATPNVATLTSLSVQIAADLWANACSHYREQAEASTRLRTLNRYPDVTAVVIDHDQVVTLHRHDRVEQSSQLCAELTDELADEIVAFNQLGLTGHEPHTVVCTGGLRLAG